MSQLYIGYILTILSAAGFAFASLAFKWGLEAGMTVWTFTVTASLIGLGILGPLTALQRGRAFPAWRSAWRGYLLFALFGGLGAIPFNVALVHLPISLATILLYTYPAFVALGAWLLLDQRLHAVHVAVLVMSLVGVLLTVDMAEMTSGSVSGLGVGLALLTAVGHAAYMIMGQRLSTHLPALSGTMLGRVGILLGALLLHPRVVGEIGSISAKGWLICLVAALFGGVLPYFCLNKGIALIGASPAAIVAVAELPMALLMGLLFQGEAITLVQWAGAALIGAAVVISNIQTLRNGAYREER